ncbi:MarR family transcriptional regulator [Maricaulis sp.]|uniref:MarR family winged helix-turn-helix transcriptional regulator n=1 Tax=Maricaulis sp. TaxID=1486257 RepID=UPI001B2E181F|nr:MarR family transcriptional regulator [Maricaulis sp.]MBO6797536.1 MarR family transcriptional regulator [Maricaulis sp.]
MGKEEERDFIEELGHAVLPHHVRRLLDTVLKWEGERAAQLQISVPLKTHSMLVLLSRRGPMKLGEVVAQLRLSRPLIVKFADTLVGMEMVTEQRPSSDRRVRLLGLTEAGQVEVSRIEAFLEEAQARYRVLGQTLGNDLLDLVTQARKRVETWD